MGALAGRASGQDLAPDDASLVQGLRWYLPLDGQLQAFDPTGIECEAAFVRSSPACLPGLLRKEKHEPRFLPGRFGQSLLVEYMGRNRFPHRIADAEAAPAGFTPFQQAGLGRGPGLEGNAALEVRARAAGAGFVTEPVTVPLSHYQTFSLYLKGPRQQQVELSALVEGEEQPLGSLKQTLDGTWQRLWLDYVATPQRDPPYESQMPPSALLRFRVTLDAPGVLLADALMLEAHTGYGGRRSRSSWIGGDQARAGEILSLPPPDADAGSLAFWFRPLGNLTNRVLVCLDDAPGLNWSPDLRLDLRENRRLELVVAGRPAAARKDLGLPRDETRWRHAALAWEGPDVRVWLDGAEMIHLADAPPRSRLGRITLGGVATNASPSLRADALFDEFAQWSRAISAEEVARLARRGEPLSPGPQSTLTLTDREPIRAFARDDTQRAWHFRLTNRSASAVRDAVACYGIPDLFDGRASLPPVAPGASCDFSLPWSPALVRPGDYEFRVEVRAGNTRRRYACPLSIVRARPPAENVQVINWSGIDEDLPSLGVTSGGITGSAEGFPARDVELATRRGMYSQLRQFLAGEPSDPAGFFVDVAGRVGQPDQRGPAAVADLTAAAERLARQVARFPDVRQMIINSEHQWISAHDARPATVLEVKRRFGLDLGRWMASKPDDARKVTHPLGRLSAKAGAYAVRAGGVVPADDPFYAYHRWWLSGAVGNEVFVNDFIARTVRAQAPWVQCIAEPVLRRPAVRAFTEQDIVEEWFYYPSPPAAIWTQEAATAAARGSRARVAGMPQFLLKPGMAAPYGGFPTPHLYREAVWHCIARPLVALTYWNLRRATQRPADKSCKTQAEIDALLGAGPDWKAAESKIERRGEWTSLFLFIPELRDEVARIHHQTVHPLGALLTRWKNRPRRLALYPSFAAQLFNEVRWPRMGDALYLAAQQAGVPYDVLYDEDFEAGDRALDGYQVVLLLQCAALPERAVSQLRRFIARGGRVIADEQFGVALEGVTRFPLRGAASEADAALDKAEQELLRQYGRTDHPLYLEGMQQAAEAQARSGEPGQQVPEAIRAALALDATTPARHVFWNLLEAHGANYLVAVNGLRVAGKHYGHFGRVREDGVRQSAEFLLSPSLGRAAYDLPSGKALPLEEGEAGRKLRLDLPPAGGRVVIFLPEEIESLRLDPPAAPVRGKTLRLSARLLGRSGAPLPGVVPVEAVLLTPEGNRHDDSRYGAAIDGAWSMDLPIAYNEPPGRYSLEVRELASGRRASAEWTLESLPAAVAQP